MKEDKVNISKEDERKAMEEEKRKKSEVNHEKVPFYKLFLFADRNDAILMIIGTISAVANGLTQPLLILLFSQLVNAFGSFQIFSEVSKVSVLN